MSNNWEKLSSKYVHENPWYKVRQDNVVMPNGQEGTYNVIEGGASVFMIPMTTDRKILLIKLFRYTTQHEGWEVPAGGIEPDELPLQAAKRELKEETGCMTEDWQDLGSFESANGTSDHIGHVFVAKNLIYCKANAQAEEGITRVKAHSFSEVLKLIEKGEMVDALSIAALMKAFAKNNLL
jgi:8-oxo-dGTP pyrophosphatase MutT (NUDIX family)